MGRTFVPYIITPMLIWKSVSNSFMLEDTPTVSGVLASGRTLITDRDMVHGLELKGYGEQEAGGLVLDAFESLYLLYVDRLVLKKARRRLGFDDFLDMCHETDPQILTKFLIYRDLRSRGYVVKDGFALALTFACMSGASSASRGRNF